MPNLPIPDNAAIKDAVKWISEELKSNSGLKRRDAVNEASVKFDLSPLETEYLLRAESIPDDKN